jgi:hypothetical protein
MIYKMFDGRHIDLSKVVAVGAIESKYDWDGYFLVWFQLMDKPLQWDNYRAELERAHSVLMEAWSALVNERGSHVQQN